MGYIEKFSISVSDKLGDKLNKSIEEKKVLNYGLFIILHTSLGILTTFIVGIFTDMIIEIMTISIVAAILKRYSGGIHSSSPERCLITGLILSFLVSLVCNSLAKILDIRSLVVLILVILSYSYYEINKKCPVPSKNKPLKNENTKKKMKKNAFKLMHYFSSIIVLSYFIYFLTEIYLFKILIIAILLGIMLQVFALTKLGEKVIGILEMIFNFIHIS